MSRIRFGKYSFNLGIFFLASAPALASIPILLASILGSIKRKDNFFSCKTNLSFILAGILMIFIFFIRVNFNLDIEKSIKYNNFIGLFNWLPFFWIFWAIKPYLSSKKERDSVALNLICGTIPVLLSGFSQYFFKVNGPFKALWGLIIWYQRDHGSIITSLFSNQNYAGSWLALILPFAIFFSLKKQPIKFFKVGAILITFSITLMIILTNSRNAIGSIFITSSILFPFIVSNQSFIFLSIIIIFCVILTNIFPEIIKNIFQTLPEIFSEKLTITQSSPRFEIWSKTINFIKMNPFIGYGAGTFPIIYRIYGGINDGQHAHNLFLQLIYDYGLPSSLLIFIPFSLILLNGAKVNFFCKKNLNNEEIISNKVWFNSLLIFFITHFFDVTYFDIRISLLFWILLSGNHCIFSELQNYEPSSRFNN